MDSLIGPFVDKGKSIVTNITSLDENQQTLIRKKEELSARESDVKSLILNAEEEEKGKCPTEEAKLWLRDVEQFKGEVDNIINQISSSNLRSKARLAQKVATKIEEADSLLKRGQLPYGIFIDRSLRGGKEIMFEPPSLHGQSTAEKTMDEIMELLLMKPEIKKIGVYGMGGVGKTTIMQNIFNKLKARTVQQQFDRIVWVTVSKDMGGVGGLQSRIACALGVTLDNEQYSCQVTRAAVLLTELKRAKTFLLVLDDLWEEITLEEIGIPNPDREGNDCKILVTTRRLSVCDFIETHRDVEVKCLSKEEAWKLFVDKVGDHVLQAPNISSLAREVVQELEGLPLAITTVGCTMRRARSVREWRHTLNVLRSSMTDGGLTGMQDKVFKFLRFSYDHLREEVQKCFLYCAFYPEDWKIQVDELIFYWVAEGYTMNDSSLERSTKRRRKAEDYDGTWNLEAEFDKGHKILQELIDSCMLETLGEFRVQMNHLVRVQMHDLIRDMAIQIMGNSEDYYCISKAGLGLTEFPVAAWDEEATKISLMGNHYMETLPNQLSCPNLSTLLLCHNYSICLHESFFSGMLALRVLDLSHNRIIPQLPESLSDLTNLRALFLRSSRVAKIPSLAKLKELRILNLSYSEIKELPKGMEELVNLRYLDLSGTYGVQYHSLKANVLRRLACLEFLHGDSTALHHSPIYNTIIEEIGSLKQLTTLVMMFTNFGSYQNAMKHIQWKKLKAFYITLDLAIYDYIDPRHALLHNDKTHKVVDIFGLPSWRRISSFSLPNQTDKLVISKWKNIPNFSSLLPCWKNLRSLKALRIRDIEFNGYSLGDPLVEMGDQMEPYTFLTLEELELVVINEMAIIWRGAVPKDNLSFTNLKNLVVSQCCSLKTLFTNEILQHLKNIEVICAISCPQLEKIESERVDWESLELEGMNSSTVNPIDQEVVVVPKLRILFFDGLPLLNYVTQRVWVCNSLEHIGIFGCPGLKKLPFQRLPTSANIHGERNWWEEDLEWDSAELKSSFQPSFKEGHRGLLHIPEVRMYVSDLYA